MRVFPTHKWEYYDLMQEGEHKRDTLLEPPFYKNKWVITNPPYLAKNKAKNKELFSLYDLDDLYKIAISTMLESEGGILIIPINFFSDKRSKEIRVKFLERFKILQLNVFEEQIFKTTTYNVCSFAFIRSSSILEKQEFPVVKDKENFNLTLQRKFDYRIGGDFFYKIEDAPKIFSRYIKGEKNLTATHLFINCLDRRKERINASYREEIYEGKKTDRIFATLTSKKKLTKEQEQKLIKMVNEELERFRKETHDLCLTNYRDNGRKRIGFNEMYSLCSYCLIKVNELTF